MHYDLVKGHSGFLKMDEAEFKAKSVITYVTALESQLCNSLLLYVTMHDSVTCATAVLQISPVSLLVWVCCNQCARG